MEGWEQRREPLLQCIGCVACERVGPISLRWQLFLHPKHSKTEQKCNNQHLKETTAVGGGNKAKQARLVAELESMKQMLSIFDATIQ